MQTVLIVIHIFIVLAMIGVVLLQKSEGGALGMGGGGGLMANRSSGNALTRTTAWLGGLFFATSLLLSALAGMGRQGTIFGQSAPATQSAPGQTAPAPASPGQSILDQLKSSPPAAPAPAAPSGPQAPQSQ